MTLAFNGVQVGAQDDGQGFQGQVPENVLYRQGAPQMQAVHEGKSTLFAKTRGIFFGGGGALWVISDFFSSNFD